MRLSIDTPACDQHVINMLHSCSRMCGYDPEYLKDSCLEKNRGSQKLLHWSAKDVARWVCSIELDEYVGAMDTSGIHGAVMVSIYYAVMVGKGIAYIF